MVAVEQPSQGGLGAGEVALERVAAYAGGVCGAQRLEPPVDLRLDQCRVVEQLQHPRPDELVDLREADGPVLADASFGAAVPVGARAAVVLAQDPLGLRVEQR